MRDSGLIGSGFRVLKVIPHLVLRCFLGLSLIGCLLPSWAENDSQNDRPSIPWEASEKPEDTPAPDTSSLGPVFAPLTDRKDLSILNRMSTVSQAEAQIKAIIERNSAQPSEMGKVVDGVVGLETQSEAERVIFHDDGSVEFRDQMQPLVLNQDIGTSLNQADTRSSGENFQKAYDASAYSGDSPSLLRELDNQNDYLLFTAPLSTESYEVTTEEKLVDPEAHQFLPGFQQAFDAVVEQGLTGNEAGEPPNETLSGKGKKPKPQKSVQRKPPARPLQQSPPLPTIESIHITRLNRTPAPAANPDIANPGFASPVAPAPPDGSSVSSGQSGINATPTDASPPESTSNPQKMAKKTVARQAAARQKTPSRQRKTAQKATKTKHLETTDVSKQDWQQAASPAAGPTPKPDKPDKSDKSESDGGVSMPSFQQEPSSEPAITGQATDGNGVSSSGEQADTLQNLIQRLESP